MSRRRRNENARRKYLVPIIDVRENIPVIAFDRARSDFAILASELYGDGAAQAGTRNFFSARRTRVTGERERERERAQPVHAAV